MMGRDHALSGAATGLAVSEFGLHLPLVPALALTGFTACFATLPDIDTRGSCAARSLGPLSEGFAWCVGKISGGHRHGSHSLLGVAVFTFWAFLVCLFSWTTPGRWILAGFLLFAVAAGLRAFHVHGHLADALGLAAACAVAVTHWHLVLIPIACGLGCATHLAGDMLTESGCPLLWPFTLRRFRWWPEPFAFTTGTRPERFIAAPLFGFALLALAVNAVHPLALPR